MFPSPLRGSTPDPFGCCTPLHWLVAMVGAELQELRTYRGCVNIVVNILTGSSLMNCKEEEKEEEEEGGTSAKLS